jgi:hypothetical protein
MPVDKKTFDAVRQRVIATAPDGLSKVQFDELLDAELAKIDPDSKVVPPPETPERSWGDVALSAKDTVAEFAPAALATALSPSPGGRYLGYAGGQGIREAIQRGGQIPGAIADIYRNLRDGDPNVRFAMMKGAAQGAAQGASNLIPGSRSTQEAIASLQADKPGTATAQGIDAALDIATVGGAKAVRKVFTNRPERAILGTLLGLGGATVGEKAADVGADVADLTPDQRELARKLVSIPAAAATASFAHPKVSGHPVTAGVAVGGTSLALGASPLAAFNAGLSTAAGARLKPYALEWLRIRSEELAMKAADRVNREARQVIKDKRQAAQYAAKNTAVHARMNDKLASAKTMDDLVRAREEWDAILSNSSDVLTAGELAQVNKAAADTFTLRSNQLSKEAAAIALRESQLSEGLEPGDASVKFTSKRTVDGVERKTEQTLRPRQSEPTLGPNTPAIFDELARRSMPSTLTPNEIRDQLKNRPSLKLIVIAQELADKPIHTPATENLRSEYSALYKGLTGAAPTTSNQFSPSHVQGKWFASGMNEADKSLLSAATKSPRGRITVTGLDVGN